MTHTTTPWRKENLPNGRIGIRADNHGYICFVPTDGPNPDRNVMQVANAAFIVRAVNNHDALVKALEQIVSEADSDNGLTAWDGADIARATLAAVKWQKALERTP